MLAEDNRTATASGNFAAAHDGQTMIQVRRAVAPALEEAETKDHALIKVIRDELRSNPKQPSPSQRPPPLSTPAC